MYQIKVGEGSAPVVLQVPWSPVVIGHGEQIEEKRSENPSNDGLGHLLHCTKLNAHPNPRIRLSVCPCPSRKDPNG